MQKNRSFHRGIALQHAVLVIMLVITLTCLFTQSHAQYRPADSASFNAEKYRFEKVIIVKNTSKSQLFDRARFWALNNFRALDDKLVVQDEKSGRLLLTAKMLVPDNYVFFTAIIDIGVGKCRIILDNFEFANGIYDYVHHQNGGKLNIQKPESQQVHFSTAQWKRLKYQIYLSATGYLQNLEAVLNGKGQYVAPFEPL